MKKRKRLLLMMGLVSLVVLLSACGTSEVSAQSTGFWERYVVITLRRLLNGYQLVDHVEWGLFSLP